MHLFFFFFATANRSEALRQVDKEDMVWDPSIMKEMSVCDEDGRLFSRLHVFLLLVHCKR